MQEKPTYEELEKRVKELEGFQTRCMKAEKALQKSQERYHLLSTATSDYIYSGIMDDDGKQSPTENDPPRSLEGSYAILKAVVESPKDVVIFALDCKYQYLTFNRSHHQTMKRIWGVDITLGSSMLDYIKNPDDRLKAKKNFDRALSGESFTIEEEYGDTALDRRCYEDIYNPIIDENGNIIGLTLFLTDITTSKQAEEALRESELKFRSLFDLSPQAIAVTDVETGRLIDVNYTFCKVTKYNKEEVLGETTTELGFYSKEDRNRFIGKLKSSAEIDGLEMDFRAKDGSIINSLMFSRYIHLKGKTFIITVFLDETERKRLESQLFHAQKMESIGTLAGGVAHDFNNILSPIMIHSEMALMNLPADNPLHHALNEILKAGERARDLVKQILTFSRKREGERVATKIIPILKEALKMLRSSLPTTIEIKQNLEAKSDIVLADPTQIHQIILNLGTNAAHALREKGGILEVSLIQEDIESEAATQYSDLTPGSYLKLTVKDNGSGIDNGTINKIFEPYFTTKGVGEGTGMGLALVHGIVKSHGGDITVESELGKGTTFHVFLPADEDEILRPIEPRTELPKGNERILFIDDEKVVIDAIQPMLELLGYTVTARTSSIEAIELFRHKPEAFDLVITDQTMPNMTGDELSQELMKIRSDIQIILCTGFSEKIDEVRAKEMGISAYVMKPIVIREIANTIRVILDKK